MASRRKNANAKVLTSDMPTTTVDNSKSVLACPICCEEIVEATETSEGQEAVLCDGTCQKWLHRWCAGVHKEDYCALASSNKPFLCPACCLSEHRQLITSLLGTVESLKEEVRQLKKDKLTLLPVENPDISNEELHGAEVVEPEVAEPLSALQEKDKPWQTVTRERKRGQRGRKGDRGAGPVMQATSTTTSNSGASST